MNNEILEKAKDFKYKIDTAKDSVARVDRGEPKDLYIEVFGGSTIKCFLTNDEVSMIVKIISVLQKDNLDKLEKDYLAL